jgi:RNA polymerase sigma-70 factor (ECF subfamily)
MLGHSLVSMRTVSQGVGGREVLLEMEWVDRYYAGERQVLEEVYRENFDHVSVVVGTVLQGADRETVIHEVFLRVIHSESFRRSFHGGDLGAWLGVVARNQAIDYARRRSREAPAGVDLGRDLPDTTQPGPAIEARLLIDRFRREVLPPQWRGVFEARFLQNMTQSEAAAALGTRRTTLAYQELRVRRLLRKFLLEDA